MGLEPSNERMHQKPELGGIEGPGRLMGIDKQRLTWVVLHLGLQSEGDHIVRKGSAHGGSEGLEQEGEG